MTEFVHDSVPLVKIVSYLDRVVSALLVVVEPFDVVNVFVTRAICRIVAICNLRRGETIGLRQRNSCGRNRFSRKQERDLRMSTNETEVMKGREEKRGAMMCFSRFVVCN